MNAPAYRIDGRDADAAAFYAAACDPRASAVVEACAGAGKTWLLVSRIVRALLAGAAPSQILAITFTKKAAGEMRERLAQWLAEFAAPAMDDERRAAELVKRGASAAEARALAPRLGALQAELLAGGRDVEIRTFHGWFAQLVGEAPLPLLQRLGLPPGADLIEDPAPLRPELMRRFHRAVNADPALRVDYVGLVASHRRNALLTWLDASWQRSTEIEAAIEAGTLDGSVPSAADAWPECAGLDHPGELLQLPPLAAEVDALARRLGAHSKSRAQQAGDRLRDALAAPDGGSALEAALKAVFTDKGTVRKDIESVPGVGELADRLETMRVMVAQQAAHEDHLRMARLARVLIAEFAALKRERGLADMPDLERAALALLSARDVAGWVQERLDQRLRHVLIDEFQDTSPLQWHALHAWLSSYAGAGHAPAVFVVGDPKQSIYRFRRADPRVFVAARDFVVEGLGGRVLECDHTRRCAPSVVAALNAVFADAARLDGWTPFRPHTTSSDVDGAVQRLPEVETEPAPAAEASPGWRDSLTVPRRAPERDPSRDEAERIADGVAALVADGFAPGDVMVLARRRVTLPLVADALAARGVPHVMPEPVPLADAPAARDLIALLDALASPGHDLALARALRSPLFGASDADLVWLMRESRSRRVPWQVALAAEERPPGAALARARALLGRWADAARRLPPHDLIDLVVAEGDLLERVAAATPPARRHGALQALQAVLAAALEHEGGRYAGLYRFVRALKSGLLTGFQSVPPDAVPLLTVHGAKGLEARAVFVADCAPQRRPPETATLLVDWPVGALAPTRVAFVRSESKPPPTLAALYADEFVARDREALNGLYVAMTRAAERLVVSRTRPSRPPDERSWWDRVEAHAAAWSPPDAAPAHAETVVDVQVLAPPRRAFAPAVAPPPAADAGAARLGQAVHRALEWIGRPGASLPVSTAAAAAAAALGVDAAAVRAVVGRIVASPACARFFGGLFLRWAGNEVPMADAQGSMRLDRLVLLEDEGDPVWWVVDYKLNASPAELPAYREQMARYVAAVAAAQPGATVRGGFVSGRGEFFAAA